MAEIEVKELTTAAQRLVGLLGTRLGDKGLMPVLLNPCNSIHTFGMNYPIDVAFVDKNNKVVRTCYTVVPGRMLRAPRARRTLERPSTTKPWPREGQVIAMESKHEDKGRITYVRF